MRPGEPTISLQATSSLEAAFSLSQPASQSLVQNPPKPYSPLSQPLARTLFKEGHGSEHGDSQESPKTQSSGSSPSGNKADNEFPDLDLEMEMDSEDDFDTDPGFKKAPASPPVPIKDSPSPPKRLFSDVMVDVDPFEDGDFSAETYFPKKRSRLDAPKPEQQQQPQQQRPPQFPDPISAAKTKESDARVHSFDAPDTPADSMQFVGFKTAKGNNVKINEDLVRDARRKFEDEAKELAMPAGSFSEDSLIPAMLPAPDTRVRKPLSRNTGDFVTPRKMQQPSASSPSKPEILVAETPPQPSPSMSFPGLVTAGGKKIEISKEALEQQRRLFEEEDEKFLQQQQPQHPRNTTKTRGLQGPASPAPAPASVIPVSPGITPPRKPQGLSRKAAPAPQNRKFKTPSKVAPSAIHDKESSPGFSLGSSSLTKTLPTSSAPSAKAKSTHFPLFALTCETSSFFEC